MLYGYMSQKLIRCTSFSSIDFYWSGTAQESITVCEAVAAASPYFEEVEHCIRRGPELLLHCDELCRFERR